MIAWLFENSIAFVLVFFWGYFVAKFLRGGFFAVILGLFLGLMYYDVIASKKSFILDIVFIIGVLQCWYDLKSKLTEYASYGWYTGIEKISSVIKRMQQKNIQKESNQAYDSDFHDQINEELNKERSKREQAEKREQRYKEEARRAREEANNQHNQPPPSQDELDPTNLKDAFKILGVPYGTDKAECKKAFRKLMAMYHPDKLAGFSGWRKEQMEKEAKMIGVAWDTIKNNP